MVTIATQMSLVTVLLLRSQPKIMSAFYNAQGGAIAISDQPTKVHKRKHQVRGVAVFGVLIPTN